MNFFCQFFLIIIINNFIHKTIKDTLFQNITNFPCGFLYNNDLFMKKNNTVYDLLKC